MNKKQFTLDELAKRTKSTLVGDGKHIVNGVEDLESASPLEVSFLANPRYEGQMRVSKAGAIFIYPSIKRPNKGNFLLNESPSNAFQEAINLFFPKEDENAQSLGIHKTAIIHEEASIGAHVTIGPFAVIEKGVQVGEGTKIGSHSFIGANTNVGKNCILHPHVTIRERCQLGKRVVIQPGAVIGSCGFGYATDTQGRHTSLRQVGIVVLEDDVEIGANTTIDRARFKTTRICRGTKIDNLVQIGHQVCVGEDNLIVSQTGIAGSSKTGKNVILAGQVGIIGHITIGDHVILAARTAASKSIQAPGIYSGTPATPIREYNKHMIRLRKVPPKLEERIAQLENQVTIRKTSS